MGRRCLLTSWIGLCLVTGTISASFQDKGSLPSRKEVFIISMMAEAKRSVFSFKSHPGILSGPCALAGWAKVDIKGYAISEHRRGLLTEVEVLRLVGVNYVYQCLSSFIEPMLSNNLTAYRKDQNCEISLIGLVERRTEAVDNRNVVGVLSTDMSKAFDSLYPPLLINKLRAYGFSNNSLTLMRSYFTNRKNRIRISQETTSDWYATTKGCPFSGTFFKTTYTSPPMKIRYSCTRWPPNIHSGEDSQRGRKHFNWGRKQPSLSGITTIFYKEIFLSMKWWVWARGIGTRIYTSWLTTL